MTNLRQAEPISTNGAMRDARLNAGWGSEQQAEPVAWMFQHSETGRMNYVSNDGIHNPTTFIEMNPRYALVCPLYTTPPQRQWVGLTTEEVKHLYPYGRSLWGKETFEAIEKALKDKNT